MEPVNKEAVEWSETEQGAAHWRRKSLSEAADADDLGCSLYELPSDSTSFPYHYHTGNAEAMYVLAGTGTLRIAGEYHGLAPGEYVPFPASKAGAHQVVNDSDGALRYLMLSTMNEPDVTVYPDSGKVGVAATTPGDGFYRFEDAVDYWTDE